MRLTSCINRFLKSNWWADKLADWQVELSVTTLPKHWFHSGTDKEIFGLAQRQHMHSCTCFNLGYAYADMERSKKENCVYDSLTKIRSSMWNKIHKSRHTHVSQHSTILGYTGLCMDLCGLWGLMTHNLRCVHGFWVLTWQRSKAQLSRGLSVHQPDNKNFKPHRCNEWDNKGS